MADRRIRIRENDRHISRGCYFDTSTGRFMLQATDTEVLTLPIDYTDILDGATITATLSADGLTATSTVAAGVITLTLSAVASTGDLDMTVTFSDGRIRQEFFRLIDPHAYRRDDYYPSRAQ